MHHGNSRCWQWKKRRSPGGNEAWGSFPRIPIPNLIQTVPREPHPTQWVVDNHAYWLPSQLFIWNMLKYINQSHQVKSTQIRIFCGKILVIHPPLCLMCASGSYSSSDLGPRFAHFWDVMPILCVYIDIFLFIYSLFICFRIYLSMYCI